jgi:hypothetical protein
MARASAVNRSARARRLTGGGVACTRLPRAVSRPGPAGVGMGMHLGTCRDRTPGASPGGGALDVQTHSRACQRPCAEDSHVKICERENPHANLHPLRTARAHSRRPSQPTTRAPCPGPLTRGSPPHRPPPAYLVPCGRGCGQQWRWWSVLGWRTKPDLPHELYSGEKRVAQERRAPGEGRARHSARRLRLWPRVRRGLRDARGGLRDAATEIRGGVRAGPLCPASGVTPAPQRR